MSLIELNPLEFRNVFPRPGKSLNLAVFVIMSLNPLENIRVIPCQINRFLAIFPRTSSDSFEIWHTCRNCLETNIRQIFLI